MLIPASYGYRTFGERWLASQTMCKGIGKE